MSFAHLTLPTQKVGETARFIEETLGYRPNRAPANSPVETVWLDIGNGQEMHLVYVEGFEVSGFEGEFGRHVSIYFPLQEFASLKHRLAAAGAEIIEPLRTTPHERIFFREPVNGYVFEVIDQAQRRRVPATG